MRDSDRAGDDVDLLVAAIDRYSTPFTAAVDDALGTDVIENGPFLALVSLRDGEPHGVARLGETARVPRRTLTAFLRALEARGVVELGPASSDRRRQVARLTVAGARRFKEAEARLSEFFVTSAPLAREIAEAADRVAGRALRLATPAPSTTRPLDLAALVAETGLDLMASLGTILGDQGWERVRGRRLHALNAIDRRGGCRPSALVADLQLSPGGVSYVLDGLEADGLIVRTHGVQGDRRGVMVSLTEDGRVAAGAFREAVRQNAPALHQRFAAIGAAAAAA